MDFALTSEQTFIQETLRKFMERECPREKAHALDEENAFPRDLLPKIVEIGLCGLNVPEPLGGMGQDLIGTVVGMEEIASISPQLAALLAAVCLCGGQGLSRFGSTAQQQLLLPRIAKGELKVSFALEADLDGEPAGVRAQRKEDIYSLTGQVPHVAFACPGGADYLIAQTHSADGHEGVSLFLVPLGSPGLRVQATPAVGMRGIGLGEVRFDQVRLSPEAVLGGPGKFEQSRVEADYLDALDHLSGAALGLGIAQGAYAYTLNYARERSQFGQTLLEFEAVEHMLVDQAVQLQSARWLLYHACWLADQGKAFGLEAAMARLQAGALARQAGLQSIQVLGGYGYMAEYDSQRSMRDSLALFPGGESTELLKSRIGRQLHSL